MQSILYIYVLSSKFGDDLLHSQYKRKKEKTNSTQIKRTNKTIRIHSWHFSRWFGIKSLGSFSDTSVPLALLVPLTSLQSIKFNTTSPFPFDCMRIANKTVSFRFFIISVYSLYGKRREEKKMLTKLYLIIDSGTFPFYEASFAVNKEFPVYMMMRSHSRKKISLWMLF